MRSRAPIVFQDRADAGRRLAAMLSGLRTARPVVLGLPRGGVPVAAQVATALDAPLDVILVRKLGVPYQPELAVGAVGEGGVRVVNDEVRRSARVDDHDLAVVEAREGATLERMARVFRNGRPPVPIEDRTVVLVDDGIATGSTSRAACLVARARGASRVVLAAPVIPAPTLASLRDVADEIVCVEAPEPFFAIGQWYDDFAQTSDEQVVHLLDSASRRVVTADAACTIEMPTGAVLPGTLSLPEGAIGVVVFAHGSGSSRSSPRNQAVARHLQQSGLGTLLFDLLTASEAEVRSNVFDVALLSERLVRATRHLEGVAKLPVGYFGASTGGVAALWAAASPGASVAAVVSRGGRPDLAGPRLRDVRAPTLLVVGGRDPEVLELNRRALDTMRCTRELAVVEGATHLFEEPGTMARVSELAATWFSTNFLVTSDDLRTGRTERNRR